MIHPSETDTADVNEFGAVRIPEEILRKLGAGVGDLISFVKDGDSIRLVVKNKNRFKKTKQKNLQA
jgi:bifunctional DNA-binding transcriptional regulator/antitoxin component of YhaV-PrlF toxin-antitoxin module